MQPDPSDYFVLKPRHSGLYGTPLEMLLECLGVTRLVLAGTTTNSCVWFTAADAHVRGYGIVVAADATVAAAEELERCSLYLMQSTLGAEVLPAESIDFTTNPLELVLRGTATYWFLFLIFRFLMRRDVGAVGIADVLLLVLVADAAQPAMTGEYQSVTEGAIVVGTIVGWNWLLDALSYHYRWVARIVVPRPMVLTRLRQNGIDKVGDVRIACLEPDGEISVFKYRGEAENKRHDRNAPV